MLVMKCDRCGKIYHAEECETEKFNSIVFANHSLDEVINLTDYDGCIIFKDFCDNCVSDFEAFLNNTSTESESDENQTNEVIIDFSTTFIDYSIFGRYASCIEKAVCLYNGFEPSKQVAFFYKDLLTIPYEELIKYKGIGKKAIEYAQEALHKIGLKFNWEEN